MDYLGSICSVDDTVRRHEDTGLYRRYDVSSLKYTYYLPSGAAVCVNSCPSADDSSRFYCAYDEQARGRRPRDTHRSTTRFPRPASRGA